MEAASNAAGARRNILIVKCASEFIANPARCNVVGIIGQIQNFDVLQKALQAVLEHQSESRADDIIIAGRGVGGQVEVGGGRVCTGVSSIDVSGILHEFVSVFAINVWHDDAERGQESLLQLQSQRSREGWYRLATDVGIKSIAAMLRKGGDPRVDILAVEIGVQGKPTPVKVVPGPDAADK